MEAHKIRFEDGAAYERYMGEWSRRAGERFLEWLGAPPKMQWLDVGCGNGAFTEAIFQHGDPASVEGIDPSPEQIAFARERLGRLGATFHLGDAMALPFPDGSFDVAIMPLVIFFVPVPAKGVSELTRVVRPGGIACAYAWDMPGGGHPYHSLQSQMREMGVPVPVPPCPDASKVDVLQQLWVDAGLSAVETKEIVVQRAFSNFDDYWESVLVGPSVSVQLQGMGMERLKELKDRMHQILPADRQGRIVYSARANAVRGVRASES